MKKSLTTPLLLIGFLTFLLPQAVFAHNIGGTGMLSGITHPLFGLDHLLAMVAVGVISTQLGGKAVWKVPATFVGFMIVGGLLSILGLQMPAVEMGIALSVLVLGAVIAFSSKIPNIGAFGMIALFAIFHGHAHGSEMPVIANFALYAIGFVASTTLLHVSGVLIGHFAKKTQITQYLLRFAGAGVGVMGLMFLVS
jgi:urease accessory protein